MLPGRSAPVRFAEILLWYFSDLTAKRERVYVLYVLYVLTVLSVLNVLLLYLSHCAVFIVLCITDRTTAEDPRDSENPARR
ncbi:hypothetical protein ACX46_004659 [Salmonella enterica subsp. houtenae]|nr:hypothetical protein [Salmonella enterica subsp. houtenae]